jgi:hypothetical protein
MLDNQSDVFTHVPSGLLVAGTTRSSVLGSTAMPAAVVSGFRGGSVMVKGARSLETTTDGPPAPDRWTLGLSIKLYRSHGG